VMPGRGTPERPQGQQGAALAARRSLAGTAAAKQIRPRCIDRWLELLRVIAELVAAAPVGHEGADAAEEPRHRNQTGMPEGGQPHDPTVST
jgi:hypothetical protein